MAMHRQCFAAILQVRKEKRNIHRKERKHIMFHKLPI